MDLLRGSPSVKKLKQTQLPFLRNKTCPKATKEDKENTGHSNFGADIPKNAGRKVHDIAIVDLTNSDNSHDEEIGVKMPAADIKSSKSKKRRRRTASPNASVSKRAVLSDDAIQSSKTKISVADASENIPEIRIIPPTPTGYKSKLSDFYAPLVTRSPESEIAANGTQPRRTSKPSIVASVEAEREKGHAKEKHKYPPLSSILCRKRTRSRSPPIDTTRDGKNKKMDIARSTSSDNIKDDGTKDDVQICTNGSANQDDSGNVSGESMDLPERLSDVQREEADDLQNNDDGESIEKAVDAQSAEVVSSNTETEMSANFEKSPEVAEQSDRKDVDESSIVNAETSPRSEGISKTTPTADEIADSDEQSDSENNDANDTEARPEIIENLEIATTSDETINSDKESNHSTLDPSEAAEMKLESNKNLEINPTHECNSTNEEVEVIETSDHEEIEPQHDENPNQVTTAGNVTELDEMQHPSPPKPSSKSCGESDNDCKDAPDDVIETVDNASNKSTRKSLRRREKRKVTNLTTEDTTTVKKKSRRSLDAERKRQEKEQEKQERMKQREEQRLAKEAEKVELLKKKEEEKVRKEEERKRKRDEEEAAKAERSRIKEEERKKKREEEEAAKVEKLRKLEEKKKEKERLEMAKKLEKEKKEEEKRKEKEKRDEEKKQKELEKQQAEEEKRRRAETFKSFFKSPGRSPPAKKSADRIGIFVPFQRKQDMFLAPIHRRVLTEANRAAFERVLNMENSACCTSTYIEEIAKRPRQVSEPTIPKPEKKYISLEEDGVEIVDGGASGAEPLRAKFLSFHANYRPPYYGTWRKKSNILSYKNPFKKDNDIFDYEFDSDDEWEEPADGEDIDHSDGEDEGEGNEEDEDDGFFVPHGYLSDDEGIGEEGEELGAKPDHKLKQKQLEFEASFKRKLSTLTPVVIGCAWKDSAAALEKVHQEILDSYKPEFMCKLPISISSQTNAAENENDTPTETNRSDSSKAKNKFSVPDEAMPDLIRLLHGNPLGMGRIVAEFQSYWKLKNTDAETTYGPMSLDENTECQEKEGQCESDMKVDERDDNKQSTPMAVDSTPKRGLMENEISKSKLRTKCKEIATYTRKENMNRSCWFVHDTVLKEYGLEDGGAPVPCSWKYVTNVPKVQVLMFPQPEKSTATVQPTNPPTPKQETVNSITRFASIVSPDTILGLSKLKHEKEKSTQQASASSISKPATEKISPRVIIEESAKKIAEDKLQRAKEAVVEKAIPPVIQDSVYVILSREAVKSFKNE